MIVSEKNEAIKEELLATIGAGMTLYKRSKGYGHRGMQSEDDIIHTVINRIDIRRTYNLIDDIDKQAFIIEFDVNNIKGGVLKKYLTKESLKKSISNAM